MKAVIKTNKNAAEIQLPCSRMQMSGALSYVGLDNPSTYEIRAKGISKFGCEIELYPQSQLDELVLPVIKDLLSLVMVLKSLVKVRFSTLI